MAIDPKNFEDEEGNIRRRDNLAITLSEGDVLIDHDGEAYIVEDDDINIYISGKRLGNGTLSLIDQDQLDFAKTEGRQVYDIEDLGLNQ